MLANAWKSLLSLSVPHAAHAAEYWKKNRTCIVPNSTAVAGGAGKVRQMEAMSFPKRKHTEKAAKSNENTHTHTHAYEKTL